MAEAARLVAASEKLTAEEVRSIILKMGDERRWKMEVEEVPETDDEDEPLKALEDEEEEAEVINLVTDSESEESEVM